jgi:hypothetical protein
MAALTTVDGVFFTYILAKTVSGSGGSDKQKEEDD